MSIKMNSEKLGDVNEFGYLEGIITKVDAGGKSKV